MDNIIRDSVIIVREQDELVIRTTGELYQRFKKEYGDSIDVDVVDPINQGYLFPRLIKDVFRYKISLRQGLRTIFALRSPAVVCNGRLIMSGNKQLSAQVFDKAVQIIKER